jgi:hypothetical protein
MYRILKETIPCQMRLEWDPGQATIRLLIHKDVVPTIDEHSADTTRQAFISRPEPFLATPETWGFNGALTRGLETSDGFIPFSAELPLVKTKSIEPCDVCNGSCLDEETMSKCFFCRDGYQYSIDYSIISPIAASVALLIKMIRMFPQEERTSATTPQLLFCEACIGRGICGISGYVSPIFIDWLRGCNTHFLVEVKEAMIVAWKKMHGEVGDHDQYYLQAVTESESGRLNISCPGDACYIRTSEESFGKSCGYKITDHNIDTYAQLLTLVVALAALEMQARRELKL